MPRPIQAIIHKSALKNNLAIARKHTGNTQRLLTVVKANAYGHDIDNVYDCFKDADGFALLDLNEAVRLRTLGHQGQILLLEGLFQEADLNICVQYHLSFAIHGFHQIEWLKSYQGEAKFEVFLKMNSGMNRLGFKPTAYSSAWHTLKQLNCVEKLHHMMHFSDADGDRFGKNGTDEQYQNFQRTISDLPGKQSVSNSAAMLRHHNIPSDFVRAGIALYGSSPDYPTHTATDWGLEPTMSLRSEIIAVQHIDTNESVGYGSKFIAKQPMKIGIVACGYADGYQRISPTGTPILVNGERTVLIGRVSMDMLAVDLTQTNAEIGAEVVLWGKSQYGTILPIDEVAAASGTLGYELMCAVTTRVQLKLAD
ncbi:alanine racemase [Acinetobacter boissieri]|uniref:Alanine racemase n=1 Tax=Acinetobacter boissieri TaxID=1219383 RepID=A0A1G6GUP4_9GAMM|nr:alanine racemase [Acinetobacter boissieri]SDB85742.1 alanine racemase [Acinetobacter boissieri]